jgi:hypothetical protein
MSMLGSLRAEAAESFPSSAPALGLLSFDRLSAFVCRFFATDMSFLRLGSAL